MDFINYCFSKNKNIICKQVKNELCLFDPYRRKMVKLNPTAFEIWQLLDGNRTSGKIIEMLQQNFEVDTEILQKDVLSFIMQLYKREMIQ